MANTYGALSGYCEGELKSLQELGATFEESPHKTLVLNHGINPEEDVSTLTRRRICLFLL